MKKTRSLPESVQRSIAGIVLTGFHADPQGIRRLGGGSYGTAYLVTLPVEPKTAVVKTFRIPGMHRTEAMQIETLSAHSTVKFPKIYFLFDQTETNKTDALVMEYIDGVDAFTTVSLLFKSRKRKAAFAEAVTDGMLAIHQTKGPLFGYLDHPVFDRWTDFYRIYAKEVLAGAKLFHDQGRLAFRYFDLLQTAYDHFGDVFTEEIGEATLTHGDLNVMNMLVDKKTLRLKAFIDPFNSMWADRDFDLFQLFNLTGRFYHLFETYRKKAVLAPNVELKCAYYGYFNEILCYVKSGITMKILLEDVRKRLVREFRKAGIGWPVQRKKEKQP
jgi:fructosamine-3-kinase